MGWMNTVVSFGMCPASAACLFTHLLMDAWRTLVRVTGARRAGFQYQLSSSIQVSGSCSVHPSLCREAAAAEYGPLMLFQCMGLLFSGSVFQSVLRVGPRMVSLKIALARVMIGRV